MPERSRALIRLRQVETATSDARPTGDRCLTSVYLRREERSDGTNARLAGRQRRLLSVRRSARESESRLHPTRGDADDGVRPRRRRSVRLGVVSNVANARPFARVLGLRARLPSTPPAGYWPLSGRRYLGDDTSLASGTRALAQFATSELLDRVVMDIAVRRSALAHRPIAERRRSLFGRGVRPL